MLERWRLRYRALKPLPRRAHKFDARGLGSCEAGHQRRPSEGCGASPIDLVDGDHLSDKLKEFSLGVRREMIGNVTVEENWFTKL